MATAPLRTLLLLTTLLTSQPGGREANTPNGDASLGQLDTVPTMVTKLPINIGQFFSLIPVLGSSDRENQQDTVSGQLWPLLGSEA